MNDVVGIQAVRAVLSESPDRGRCLHLQQGRRDSRINELIGLARSAGVRFQTVPGSFFSRRLDEQALAGCQGVLLECRAMKTFKEANLFEHLATLESPALLLVLDGLTDPRNLGACLRTANAAGVDAVIIPKRQSAPINDVALKTAQGGAEELFIVEVTNLARVLKAIKAEGIWVVGTDGDSSATYTQPDMTVPTAIVMGSEGSGLRRLTRELCDHLVSIPMGGSVSSLNVSVACGVLLFEVVRQRS